MGGKIVGCELLGKQFLVDVQVVSRCLRPAELGRLGLGGGYPLGLTGRRIPLAARIVAVADVFDALTSVRPYKSAWSYQDAVEHLITESGRQFDPELTRLLVCEVLGFTHLEERFDDPQGSSR